MKRRGSFTLGFLLILLGGWFLAVQFIPDLSAWVDRVSDWPFWVIAPGLVFLLAAIISGVTDLAIPGSIITGIGLILYYQNYYNDFQSWAYVWALIIVFVGIGVFLSHALRGRFRVAFEEGGPPFLTGTVLFLIFGSIFRAAFGQSPLLGDYWPVILIVVGLWMFIRSFFRKAPRGKVITVTTSAKSTSDSDEDWEETLESAMEEMDDGDDMSELDDPLVKGQ